MLSAEESVDQPGLIKQAWIRTRLAVQTSRVRHWLISARHNGLSPNDVFLASYPKSGNTWLRHLLTYVVKREPTPWRGGLDTVSNLVGKQSPLPQVARDNGRLIKTHEPWRDEYRRAVLLVRDARDVVVSEYHYQKAYSKYFFVYGGSFENFLRRFLAGKTNGYRSWQSHVSSWLDAAENARNEILVLPFESLRGDTQGSLRKVVDHIGLEADDALLSAAISDCSVDSMKRKEREYWESQGQPNRNFVRGGKSGGWRDYFTEEMEDLFWNQTGPTLQRAGYERERISS